VLQRVNQLLNPLQDPAPVYGVYQLPSALDGAAEERLQLIALLGDNAV